MAKYVMAFDAGTTSNRTILFDKKGEMITMANEHFEQFFPKPSWVEHDAMEILSTQISTAKRAMEEAGATAEDIAAIGITNQRETTIVWDKLTGAPVCNAIVWQCRRTAEYCDSLKEKGLTEMIRQKTGLVIDAYFSGTKIRWILENIPGARQRAENGELLFGTVDTWLIWNLTKGKVHVTDYTNASRTMLFNINTLDWDEDLLKELDIPRCMLPKVVPSSSIIGETDPEFFGAPIKIAGAAGDQQSSLFGQCCFEKGAVKNSYGTGCFMLINTGDKPVFSKHGLVTTIAWGEGGKVEYALEGSVFIASAAINWVRDCLELYEHSNETESMARQVPDTDGVFFVPAFTGLGAPYWNQYAKGIITGLTRGTTKYHIVRATLESLAYQSYDVLKAMEEDIQGKITGLKADGGASKNALIMQLQADLIDAPVYRANNIESTAMGAAFLAGLAVGFWKDKKELESLRGEEIVYTPSMPKEVKEKLLAGWEDAIRRALL